MGQHVSANFQKEGQMSVRMSAEPRVQVDAQGMEPGALKAGTTEELSSEVGTKGKCLEDTEMRESQLSSKDYIRADVPTQSMPS